MSKTNYLGSHHSERMSFPANKMFPKEFLKHTVFRGKVIMEGKSAFSNTYLKKLHSKKSRAYNKNIKNFLDE